MPRKFEVKKKDGYTCIEWGDDINILLLPFPSSTSSQTTVTGAVGPAGIGGGASLGHQVLGTVVALVDEKGNVDPYQIWYAKKEIEAGLAAQGIEANIVRVGTLLGVANATGSAKAGVVAHNPTCPKCGQEMDPASHYCGIVKSS